MIAFFQFVGIVAAIGVILYAFVWITLGHD
jgi:hypothetical protein